MPEDLARQAGEALGNKMASRIERNYFKAFQTRLTVFLLLSLPEAEISAWKRIWKLSRCTYNTCCPLEIQKVVRDELKSNFSEIRHFAHLDRTQGQNRIQGDNQILHFIQNAKNILYASKHSKSIKRQ